MPILENYSIKKLNTFGIDVYAKYFLEADSVSSIQNLLNDKTFSRFKAEGKFFVLGGGSNILFTKNIDGIVVKNNIKGIELLNEDSEHYYVKVGAGENWHRFVMYCIEKNYAGVENLSLIPGSVGAAPIQNIGAYGVEQKEVFYELDAIDMQENKIVTFNKAECKFGYRDSIFKHEAKGKYIIVSVTFKLLKKPKFNISYGTIAQELEKMGVKELSVAAVSQAVCNIRRSKLPDPGKIGNAGSFFKNPTVTKEKYEELSRNYSSIVAFPSPSPDGRWQEGGFKLAAAWLIEQCGWKGKKIGNTGVHKNHALVLVNYGNATGQEIYQLSEEILQSVKKKFGVELEREVVIY
jgi:UDP-N-acetylmuramate dehydrogenase